MKLPNELSGGRELKHELMDAIVEIVVRDCARTCSERGSHLRGTLTEMEAHQCAISILDRYSLTHD